MLLYCFDLKTKDSKSYNTVKRRFYYHLSKLGKYNFLWNTKSVILVEDAQEATFDLFFFKFKQNITLFKSKIISIEQVY